MINKDSLKKVNNRIQWTGSIAMLGVCIYYFLLVKIDLKKCSGSFYGEGFSLLM